MIDTVIFDLDGLLVDTEIISYKVYKAMVEKYGFSFDKQTYAEKYSGHKETDNVTTMLNDYRLPYTFEQCFDIAVNSELELINQGVELKPFVRYLLDWLKENNYRIVLATSSLRKRALTMLNDHDIIDYFDGFVFAEDIHHGKPDPDIFLTAAQCVNSIPANCLVLEDSEPGIQAAFSANMSVICIPDMKKPAEQYRKMLTGMYNDLSEVVNFLQNN